MSQKVKHSRKSDNRFWKDPKAIIMFAILLFGSGFTCGTYFQRTESNKDIMKERNEHTIEVCKYENQITLLKKNK